MKKILIIAYAFPPVGGAGVQRPVKFVKYLREFGWEPLVLTVANPSVPVLDNALLKDMPEGVRIYRARTFEPSYTTKQSFKVKQAGSSNFKSAVKKIISSFMLPDLQILWWPGLVAGMIRVIRKEKPDCIFVTAPPFSSFIPVVIIGKIFRIPAVIDYRDEWSFSRNNWENLNKNRLAFALDAFLERFVIKQCHAFTVATQSYINGIAERYGSSVSAKGVVITNGYDKDDFALNLVVNKPASTDTGKITIIYAGTVWSATSMKSFSAALEKLLYERPDMNQLLSLNVFGRVVDDERACLESEVLRGIVECYGYVEHERVVQEMQRADVLLITLSDLPGAEKIITAKAFEYMATGKHIFAIVPEGETRNMLRENYNKLTIANASSPEDIMKGLSWIMEHSETIRNVIPSSVNRFSRRDLTEQLANVLEKAMSRFS